MRDPVLNNPNLLVKNKRPRRKLNLKFKLQPYLTWALMGLAVVGAIFLLVSLFQPGAERLPDFSAYENTNEKKEAFFNYLLERVSDVNAEILELRDDIEDIREDLMEGKTLSSSQQRFIQDWALEYDFEDVETVNLELVDDLLQRADIVPPSLVLAQAALESAWGSSRFAMEGNNLFGMRCWTPGCGIVPRRRAPGATFEVAVFRTPKDAIEAFIHNINTHQAYLDLRRLRAQQRRSGNTITGSALAGGLMRYSEQGSLYVEKVRGVIGANNLQAYDQAQAQET